MAKAVTRRPPTLRKVSAPVVPVPFIAQEEEPAVLQPMAAFTSAAALIVTEAASDMAAAVETVTPAADAPFIATQQEAAAEITAPAEQEDETIMATAADYVGNATGGADRAQAMMGDINQRAKSAFEKGGKAFEDMVELSKGNVEAIVAASRVAAKGTETLLQETAEYGRKSFEKASGAAKSYATVKSPTELLQLHSELTKTSFDSAFAEASRMSEAYLKLVSDIVEPISGRFTVAVDKLKASAL